MNHYEKIALEKLTDLKGQKKYVTSALNQGGLEAWEAKEFACLKASYAEEIHAHTQHMNSCRDKGHYA